MRVIIGLLAILLGLALCTSSVRAQDPATYDPAYYENYDYYNPRNPFSPYARHLRQLRAKKQASVLVKVQTFASGVASSVTSGAYRLVSFISAVNDPNNSIPQFASGPGSPLQQPGSLSGSAAEAMKATPVPGPLFGPTANNFNLFPRSLGTPPSPAGAGIAKQP
jgi:hypothetical protein